MQNINFSQITPLTFVLVYVSGLVTSLTPCVYPIIPIVMGYLGSKTGSTIKRLLASFYYALGLSTVYTILGMIAALTGNIFGSLTSNTYVYLFFGILLLALGGNMMDWYYIPMPNFSSGKESSKDSTFLGPFIMGFTTGLVASPCTAPVLGGLLVFIATTRAVIKGGLLMFTFSIGMSTLLLALGFFASTTAHLPKSGKWMIVVKKILAFMLLGAGIYFVYNAGKLA